MSSYFGSELGVRLAPQQSQQLGQFEFHYDRFSNEIGPNFTAEVAFFSVSEQGKPYAEIVPERRYYDVRTMTMSEVGLDAGLWGDLYIVMGDNLGKGEFSVPLALQTTYSLVMARRHFNGTWRIMFCHQFEEKTR